MYKLFSTIIVVFLFVGCSKKEDKITYLFNKLDSNETGIDFRNDIKEDPQHSIINYIYYYNGGGVAAGDINNDGLPDLFFVSNMGKNKLFINKGNLKFEDISEKANIYGNSSWNTGVTMVDINNDGFLDVYVCSVSGLLDFKGHNELFINNGDGTFTEKSKEYNLDFKGYSTQAYFFDYDKDDDLDVYIVNHAVHTTLSHGPSNMRDKRVPLVGDVLLKNENGKFIDVSESANIYGGSNGYGLSTSIADFNNDGWDDIYVCNDFHEDDYYYLNNQDGTFKETLHAAFSTISRFSMGSDAADINNDGYQDLITLDMLPKSEKVLKETEGDDAMFNMQQHLRKLGYKDQYSRNMLQINNSGTYFTETALFNDISDTDWSWGPLIADFDNDGNQDIFISNGILRRPNGMDFRKYVASAFKNRSPQDGLTWLFNSIDQMPSGKVTNEIFKGNSKKFENKTGEWIENVPSLSNGAIYVDLDLDGDLDLVTNNMNDFAGVYENSTNKSRNYISVQLKYKGKNPEGIGAKVKVFSNRKVYLKQLFKTRGFLSSTDASLHFGLDNQKTTDSIEVIWPNNTVQTIRNPLVNQRLVIAFNENNEENQYDNLLPNNSYFSKTKILDYVHSEDDYNDFTNEKLIPYKISTMGPAFTVADIDNNGYDDIFIGNASGKKAKLFLNNGLSFNKTNIKEIESDSLFEDNAAVFFDADNDNDLDLYIASGINKSGNKIYQTDRLYINEKGTFKKAINQIPLNDLVTSSVVNYDYDNDGDQDLFVGNYTNSNDFGGVTPSYILVNNGKGVFTKDLKFNLTSKVTFALWEDINNDGFKDLLISTEWDEPKIYLNKQGTLELMKNPDGIKGLWETIGFYDIDNDGDKDILLGNWGLNTKFNPSPDKPLLLYYSDFDLNGKNESILAYNKNGIFYPVNSKDELASQMNIISKRFVTHADFALKTIEDVLTKEAINKAVKYEVQTLKSGYIKNNNGIFNEFVAFPDKFQMAPINVFSEIPIKNETFMFVAGNTYKVNTYHGSYNSLKGLIVKDINNFKEASSYGITPIYQQIKAVKNVVMRNANILLIIPNNDSLVSYLSKNEI